MCVRHCEVLFLFGPPGLDNEVTPTWSELPSLGHCCTLHSGTGTPARLTRGHRT